MNLRGAFGKWKEDNETWQGQQMFSAESWNKMENNVKKYLPVEIDKSDITTSDEVLDSCGTCSNSLPNPLPADGILCRTFTGAGGTETCSSVPDMYGNCQTIDNANENLKKCQYTPMH
jgi:hypothetical protein